MEDYETTNIHIEWLKNIKEQLIEIQNLERLAKEGCNSLGEYLQIPFEYKDLVIPDIRYKNIKFLALEISMLLTNLSPVLKKKEEEYTKILKPILDNIDKKDLFLKYVTVNNKLAYIDTLPFLEKTIKYLIDIKANVIRDIGHILYLPESEVKKW